MGYIILCILFIVAVVYGGACGANSRIRELERILNGQETEEDKARAKRMDKTLALIGRFTGGNSKIETLDRILNGEDDAN